MTADLIAKLEAGDGPSRELDARIDAAFGQDMTVPIPDYTSTPELRAKAIAALRAREKG